MIGKRIAELRREKRISQAGLAADLNVSASTISMYENGSNTPPVDMIMTMSVYFNVSADYLLGLTDIRDRCETRRGAPEESPAGLIHDAVDSFALRKPAAAADESDSKFISDYTSLSHTDKHLLQELMKVFLSSKQTK